MVQKPSRVSPTRTWPVSLMQISEIPYRFIIIQIKYKCNKTLVPITMDSVEIFLYLYRHHKHLSAETISSGLGIYRFFSTLLEYGWRSVRNGQFIRWKCGQMYKIYLSGSQDCVLKGPIAKVSLFISLRLPVLQWRQVFHI